MIPRAYITEWTQYAPWKTNERDSPSGEMSTRTEGQRHTDKGVQTESTGQWGKKTITS